MPDRNKKFHEFALQSILFKGRHEWYYCHLKTEKIAQVLTLLSKRGGESADLAEAGRRAASLSHEIAHLAAGEVDAAVVLADLFALMGFIRMLGVRGGLSEEGVSIFITECEGIAERLVRGANPSPFVSAEDFVVGVPAQGTNLLSQGPTPPPNAAIKDKGGKGQNKGQSDRMSLILELVRKRKTLSIKEIAEVIKDCSEKTIQRELNALINRGLIKREGERRWSVYRPA
jgi:hypothetical protein